MLVSFSGSGTPAADCSGRSRRDLLRIGSLGLGGLCSLNLPLLLQAPAEAADPAFLKDKSVVVLFLAGGASHIETFHPNMDQPAPYCSVTGEVKTRVPGLTLGGDFPLLAQHADKLTAVRSFTHTINDHERAINHVLTGGTDIPGLGRQGFGIGGAYARIRGANHPRSGLPTYALLTAPHADGQYAKELVRVVGASRGGSLGSGSNPFVPGGSGSASANMKLNLPLRRLEDRRALLRELDAARRSDPAFDAGQAYDPYEQQAVELITGAAARAFDLSSEPAKLAERYDTRMFQIGKKVFQPSILGQQLLLARRLVEAGCGFVTVQSAGWDMHADGNNPGIEAGMHMLGPTVDKALSAFVEDLAQRGLLSKTLVILTGDFGRTPTINARGGRDHWARLSTLALFGGGLPGGRVIGSTDAKAGEPASDPVTPRNLLSAVLHTVFDVSKVRVIRGLPTDLARTLETPPGPLLGG